jgi:hypothetical protein
MRDTQDFSIVDCKVMVISGQEDAQRVQRNAFVAIIERMILNQARKENRGLFHNSMPHFLSKDDLSRSRQGGQKRIRIHQVICSACCGLETRPDLEQVKLR